MSAEASDDIYMSWLLGTFLVHVLQKPKKGCYEGSGELSTCREFRTRSCKKDKFLFFFLRKERFLPTYVSPNFELF